MKVSGIMLDRQERTSQRLVTQLVPVCGNIKAVGFVRVSSKRLLAIEGRAEPSPYFCQQPAHKGCEETINKGTVLELEVSPRHLVLARCGSVRPEPKGGVPSETDL